MQFKKYARRWEFNQVCEYEWEFKEGELHILWNSAKQLGAYTKGNILTMLYSFGQLEDIMAETSVY